jgi:hypothetical protein
VVERTGRGRGGAAAALWIGRAGGGGAATARWRGREGRANQSSQGGERTGRRLQESRGGGGSPRGKGEAAGCRALVCGLPNDGKIWPGDENDVGARPREKVGNPGGSWVPKGALNRDSIIRGISHLLE